MAYGVVLMVGTQALHAPHIRRKHAAALSHLMGTAVGDVRGAAMSYTSALMEAAGMYMATPDQRALCRAVSYWSTIMAGDGRRGRLFDDVMMDSWRMSLGADVTTIPVGCKTLCDDTRLTLMKNCLRGHSCKPGRPAQRNGQHPRPTTQVYKASPPRTTSAAWRASLPPHD